MNRAHWVGTLILVFFLTLTLTLPELHTTANEPLSPELPQPDEAELATSLQDVTPTPTVEAEPLMVMTPLPMALTPASAGGAGPVDNTAVITGPSSGVPLAPRPESAITAEIALKQLGENGVSLSGLYSSGSLWVPLPSNWLVRFIQVDLHYIGSSLLLPQRANLTVSANGERITSFPLGRGEQQVSFVVPVSAIEQGSGFLLSFTGYLRITDLVCEESNNPGQWIDILDTTRLTIGANPDDTPSDLKDMGKLLLAQRAIGPVPPVVFVLPDSPDAVTLATAAQVAARIGKLSGFARLRVLPSSALTDADKSTANLVVVGLPQDLPVLGDLIDAMPVRLDNNQFYTADNLPAPPQHGLAQIFRSPWNHHLNILVVSAGNEAGLRLAGQAFASSGAARSLTGAFQFIEVIKAQADEQSGTPWLNPQVTFASLGYQDRSTGGSGTTSLVYYFRWPPGWMLKNGTQLTLNMAFSPALQVGSHIQVSVNDQFVGADEIALSVEPQQFTFNLPAAVINQTLRGERIRTMKLNVDVVNIMDADECLQGDAEVAWARVQSDSYFKVSYGYTLLPDLRVFPYPFVSDQIDQPVVIVVPDDPTQAELSGALSLITELADYALGDLDVSLVFASDVSPAANASTHLIVLGERSHQPWVNDFLASLPNIPRDGVYQAIQNEITGVVLEGTSPWNADRTVLLAFGESSAGFERAVSILFRLPPVDESVSAVVFEGREQSRAVSMEGESVATASNVSVTPSLLATPLPDVEGFRYKIIYAVQEGDTILQLARRFDSTIDAILQANGLDTSAVIYIGQVLVIPAHQSPVQ